MPKFLILLMLLTVGCSAVGPDYSKPEMDLPDTWTRETDPALRPDKKEITRWWTVFRDPILNELIQNATRQNLDLKAAAARVEEARAELGGARGDYWPQVDGEAAASRQKTRGSALKPRGELDTYYSTGATASWELDLFGRVRRSVESATAELQATEEDRLDVMISMYAELAGTYINIRTLQARIRTAAKNIASQKEILNLTKARFRHGLANDLDVARAEQVLANTRAQVPALRAQLTRLKNSLGILLGRPPGALQKILTEPAPIPVPRDRTAAGIPADLLRRRPDIRGAERSLAAQTARIGMATAELYPAFSLTGTLDYMHTGLTDMFMPAHQAYGFGPTMRWNLFSGGKIRAQIKAEDARTKQALLSYEKTVLTALSEVENAMSGYRQQKKQLVSLRQAVNASARSLHLAERLYKDGLSDFQNVLDAQRELFSAEDRLDEARGSAAQYMVDLYRALGGGWNPRTGKSGIYPPETNKNSDPGKSIRKGEQG